MKPASVALVVVGDLARSPRIVNHARELARTGSRVMLVGYVEREFEVPTGVELHALRRFRHSGGKKTSIGWFAASGIRLLCGFIELMVVLLRQKPQTILVQNPPSFPTLAASWLAARVLRVPFLIDWHNFGYTMLGLRLGSTNRLTRLAARYEAWAGRRAQGHFCVSEAMQTELKLKFQVQAKVLYDRPLQCDRQPAQADSPVVAVCPSGWTADEDMDLLFDALELLDGSSIEFHFTGDGPRRHELESRIAKLCRNGLKIRAEYLSDREYRALLRRSAIGLSLHRSSSGVDLPMKIVDLFGAGVPVCALDYSSTLREQVSDGETGFVFRTAAELAEILRQLERHPALLTSMRQLIHVRWCTTWTDEWGRIAGPVFGVSNAA